ncbi:MAG: glycosyltransferase family 4 protein [Stellaceae bacterium]
MAEHTVIRAAGGRAHALWSSAANGAETLGQSRADARAGRKARRRSIAFVWESFAFHHLERCAACAQSFAGRYDVHGIEIATYDTNYHWRKGSDSDGFSKITLFPGEVRQRIGTLRCALGILRACIRLKARHVFLCNYESPAIFVSAVALRLLGRHVAIMQDSKFDDKQRRLGFEAFKSLLYAPYHAALAAGQRTRSYLRFLGMPDSRIFIGYDTISVARVRRMAESAPAPGGVPHRDRHFTIIARFIAKKNIALALDAFAAYVARLGPGERPRALHLCGSGELEPMLRRKAQELKLDGVKFCGYLNGEEVARVLASTLALILPSIEEQHGLVVNEALAMGVPVLVSDNCGARDLLVRSSVNGYVFEPDNADGLAYFMELLDRDSGEWRRLALGTRQFLPAADTPFFVAAVEAAIAQFE